MAIHTWSAKPALRTVTLAVPDAITDIYELHQAVWEQVARIHAREHGGRLPGPDTRFLYRREGARVAVRGTCFKHAGIPSPVAVATVATRAPSDLSKPFRVCIAPFRSLRRQDMNEDSVHAAINRAFDQAGLQMSGLSINQFGIGVGLKSSPRLRSEQMIELPYFEISGQFNASIEDEENFWINGVGRGKRFGFGMPVPN